MKLTPILIATAVAFVHLIGVGATQWFVSSSSDGQAVLVWMIWAFLDFPISLSYILLDDSFLVAHGLLGTAWWFGLAYLITRWVQAARLRRSDLSRS